jgi:hypothetical protein
MDNGVNIIEEIKEETLNEEIEMVYPLSISKSKKFKRFLNPTILLCLIIIILIIAIYLIFFFNFSIFSSLIGLIFASFFALILFIIQKEYDSICKREQILFEFAHELRRNWQSLKYDKKRILDELELVLEEDKIDIRPLSRVQFNIYNFIRNNFHEELMNMNFKLIESYIHNSHEINELIETRNALGQNKHLDYLNYLYSLVQTDNFMFVRIHEVLENIIMLLKFNGTIIELDKDKIDALSNMQNFNEFSKNNKINPDNLKNMINKFHKKGLDNLIIFILKK